MKLPIELPENEELLKRYGLAWAYINQSEHMLGVFIDSQRKRKKEFNQTCQNQTLGEKLYNNREFLDEELFFKLASLNQKRKIIAHHGFCSIQKEMDTSEEVVFDAIIKIDLEEVLIKDFENDLLKLLEETIKLGREVLSLIFEELKK